MFWKKKAYKVKLFNRSHIIYEEGNRYINIDVDWLAGPTMFCVNLGRVKVWTNSNSEDELTEDDKMRIRKNISAYLDKNSITYEWD